MTADPAVCCGTPRFRWQESLSLRAQVEASSAHGEGFETTPSSGSFSAGVSFRSVLWGIFRRSVTAANPTWRARRARA